MIITGPSFSLSNDDGQSMLQLDVWLVNDFRCHSRDESEWADVLHILLILPVSASFPQVHRKYFEISVCRCRKAMFLGLEFRVWNSLYEDLCLFLFGWIFFLDWRRRMHFLWSLFNSCLLGINTDFIKILFIKYFASANFTARSKEMQQKSGNGEV